MDVKTVRESRGIETHERKPRTTMQLPVYREASRLAYVLFRVLTTAPRKMTKMWDESMACAMEMLRTLAMANELSGEARMSYISMAIANTYALNTIIVSAEHLRVIGKREAEDMRKKTNSIIAQSIGWRESIRREGYAYDSEKGGEA